MQALSAPDVPDGVLCWTIWEVVQDRTTASTCEEEKKERKYLASEWLKHLFILRSIRAQLYVLYVLCYRCLWSLWRSLGSLVQDVTGFLLTSSKAA